MGFEQGRQFEHRGRSVLRRLDHHRERLSAGAIFQAVSSSGEFQGVIAATTPTGSRRVKVNMSALSIGSTAPSILSASPPKKIEPIAGYSGAARRSRRSAFHCRALRSPPAFGVGALLRRLGDLIAREWGVAIAIVDLGGNVVMLQRLDNAQLSQRSPPRAFPRGSPRSLSTAAT